MMRTMILMMVSWLKNWMTSTAGIMLAGFFLVGCSAVKYLPDNEYFYEGSKIIFEGEVGDRKETDILKKRLLQHSPYKGNGKIFGSRPSVWCYHIAGNPKKNAFVKKFIKNKLGTPPVFLSQLSPAVTRKRMITELNNAGYFKSAVDYEIIKNEKRKDSEIIYTVLLKPGYYFNEISYPKINEISYPQTGEAALVPIFQDLKKNSLIKPGQRYDLEMLSTELMRLEKVFKNSGFFYFDDRYLLFEADSTIGDHHVDLRLTVKQKLPEKARAIYNLAKPHIYFNNQFLTDVSAGQYNTIATNGVNFFYVDETKRNFVRPAVLSRVLNLKPGDIYSLRAHEVAISRLIDLGVFKNVNIKYAPSSQDSSTLYPQVVLTPMMKKNIRTDLKVVSKSNSTVGPVVSITFTNRNLFKGAEKFDLSVTGAYETQFSNQSSGTLNAFEIKASTALTINQFLVPFKVDYSKRRYMPKTIVKAEASFHNRVDYYDIKSFTTSWGYYWRNKKALWHELHPVSISYVNTTDISPEFADVLRLNPTLALSLQDQFIIGPRYVHTINEQYNENASATSRRNGSWYFKGGVDLSGNLLDAIMKRTKEKEQRPYEILQSPFSQYAKGDADIRYRWQPNAANKIVTRLILGAGYAYGNATTMPFVKQYAMGGASSLRAFSARTVGPGTFNIKDTRAYSEDSISFTDQYADLKLEGNVEYRFDIYKAFKGALFVDAGNIWTVREDSIRAGAKFEVEQFYKQIAMGAGVGLRIDVGFFVLRFDTAIPIRTPYSGWAFHEMDFNDSVWRKENIVLNIAVGYPF